MMESRSATKEILHAMPCLRNTFLSNNLSRHFCLVEAVKPLCNLAAMPVCSVIFASFQAYEKVRILLRLYERWIVRCMHKYQNQEAANKLSRKDHTASSESRQADQTFHIWYDTKLFGTVPNNLVRYQKHLI